MKNYLVITLSVLVLMCTGISLVGAEELYGTWINEDFNTTDKWAKLVFNQDGTFSCYNTTTTKTVRWMASFEITKKWTDTDGNLWYNFTSIGKVGVITDPYYWTVNISNSGKTFEYATSGSDYPAEKDLKKAYYHGILHRE